MTSLVKALTALRPAPKGAEPEPPKPTQQDRVEAKLDEVLDRLRRTETRVVVLMRNHGIDPYGNPIE